MDVVKASLTGSILGNLLFGMGLAMYLGGLKHPEQRFEARMASMNGNLLTLAVFGLIIPAVFQFGTEGVRREVSLAISLLLLVVYAASLIPIMFAPKAAAANLGEAKARDVKRPTPWIVTGSGRWGSSSSSPSVWP